MTSSNSSGCGIHNGSGVPEREIKKMIGAPKPTRPVLAADHFLQNSTTKSARKFVLPETNSAPSLDDRDAAAGWMLSQRAAAARISGVDSVAIALLDVLSCLDELFICEAYEINGQVTRSSKPMRRSAVKPVCTTLPGWKEDITGITKFGDLPATAQQYVRDVEQLVGKPIELVSVGPRWAQTIRM